MYKVEFKPNLEEIMKFAISFYSDPIFCDPSLVNEEQFRNSMVKSINSKSDHVITIYDNEEIKGLFCFLIIDEEKYIESLVALSFDRKAYQLIFEYLIKHYKGYQCDFVLNPKNELLKKEISNLKGIFEPEQQKMVLVNYKDQEIPPNIVPFRDEYKEQYMDIHSKDTYWTASKVIEAKDKFNIYLAIDNSKVVGYIDVSYCFKENEPFDLFVVKEYRKKGYGTSLLRKALKENFPNQMMLFVDIDNVKAIKIYENNGFIKNSSQNFLTTHIFL